MGPPERPKSLESTLVSTFTDFHDLVPNRRAPKNSEFCEKLDLRREEQDFDF